MAKSKFKILSIDGGGIRGIFPAMVLANYEAELKAKGVEKWQVYQNFDLICGTSTGGIMAIALGLGIPAKEIYELYLNNAKTIFGSKRLPIRQFFVSGHKRKSLEDLVKKKFAEAKNGEEPRLLDCKTGVAIPIYDMMEGRPSVLKSKYHDAFVRDYHIPAYQAALATSAAPTYFKPHFISKVNHDFADGGLVSNNPSFIGIREVLIDMKNDFPNAEPKDVKILNIGTLSENYCIGPKTLSQNCSKGYLGLWGMGERLVLSTMTANQHLQRFMLLRELKVLGISNNYIEIDETIPNEASSDITLDNASQSSLNALKGMGEKLGAERYSEIKELREFFLRTAKPFVKSNNNGVAA